MKFLPLLVPAIITIAVPAAAVEAQSNGIQAICYASISVPMPGPYGLTVESRTLTRFQAHGTTAETAAVTLKAEIGDRSCDMLLFADHAPNVLASAPGRDSAPIFGESDGPAVVASCVAVVDVRTVEGPYGLRQAFPVTRMIVGGGETAEAAIGRLAEEMGDRRCAVDTLALTPRRPKSL